MILYFVNSPYLFWIVALLMSTLYGIRGILWQHYRENIPTDMKPSHKIMLYYGHDFVYNFICSLAGFAALRLEANILKSIVNVSDIGVGIAGFLAFLSLVAILGISGVLPRFFYKGALIGKKD